MNWWFTNSAIILDTAGRLMFEEIAPGSTNEWAEFLKLLKNNRPNCPINGMLLVIPVDTLIKDTSDAIEKKAGKIAQQFEQIQRTLGVRFPVFVIITKCDLLNGFREFFDDLNDPQLQHQIMGWSNPAALDERFDPALVTNHLETVKTRLFERRTNLLLDPVHTEDPQARRVEQVDALYALPDSIVKIGPRLRRYLEMIFVAGEWSPKPLFLRGIYFTSSMTEGAALDAELAEALGVPVDSLPGGAIFRKDRAYFLRDLFLEKVFREKGLVTRASNADKQQQTRRAIILTCGIVAVASLLAITYFSSRALERSIGTPTAWWRDVAGKDPGAFPILDTKRGNAYSYQPAITVVNKTVTVAQLFGDNLEVVKQDVKIPAVFRPLAAIGGDVNAKRRDAFRSLYERTVLYPIFSAARNGFAPPADQPDQRIAWVSEKSVSALALAQLLKMEHDASSIPAMPAMPPATGPAEAHTVDVGALMHFVYSAPENADQLAKFDKDRESLQTVADWIYTSEAGGTHSWPPAVLKPGSPEAAAAINAGITSMRAYWDDQLLHGQSPVLAAMGKVQTDLEKFKKAEDTMLDLRKSIDSRDAYVLLRGQWTQSLKGLRAAGDDAAKDLKDLAVAAKAPGDLTLSVLYENENANDSPAALAGISVAAEVRSRSARRSQRGCRPRQGPRDIHRPGLAHRGGPQGSRCRGRFAQQMERQRRLQETAG